MRDWPLERLVGCLAARTPVPGGGTAAAVAGALGAALGAMAARFSEGDAVGETARRLESLAGELLELAAQDAAAYGRVVEARRMPKETPEEKRARRQAIQEALAGAAEVPLDTMRRCHEALLLLARLTPECNPNLRTDAASAAWLLRAALEGARHNVCVNLDTLGDERRRSELGTAADRLRAEGEQFFGAIEDVVRRGGPLGP